MRIIERFIVIIFSIIILLLSIITSLIAFGWLELEIIFEILQETLKNSTNEKIIIGTSMVLCVFSLKCIFFSSNNKSGEDYKSGVLLENVDGKLLISKDTIENLVNNVIKRFDGVTDSNTKVYLDQENNVTIYITLLVKENIVIKDLSSNIQTQIKETIKKTSDLDVKQINIKIKNIEQEKKAEIKTEVKK